MQLGIVDGSNHVLDLEFVYRFIFKIKDKFWGDEDYLEVVAQVTMETNYHVSDSKMLLQMFVERRLGCPADDIRKYVEREVTKGLCEERTMELNDDPIEFISDKFGKVAETIETSLQECSVSYLQIDDIKCKITCENQEELIVNFNQIKDKIRERITELQNVLLEMIKIVSEKPVLSDSVCSILTETAKINDTLSLKQLVDEFVKIEGDHGAEQALASVQKLLSSWRID